MPNGGLYFVCKGSVKEDERIQCDFCKSYLHGSCVNLTRKEIVCLKNVNRQVKYLCKGCNLFDIIRGLQKEIIDLKSEIIEIKKSTKTQGELANDSDEVHGQGKRNFTDDQLLEEFEERQLHAANIIVSNLQEENETGDETIPETENDLNRVVEIISSSGIKNAEIIKCYRLGKKSQNKCRPVRVVLTSANLAYNIIANYKITNKIYVNRDLTRQQQNNAYLVLKEFKTRTNNSEVNLKLKYMNGMPKIITKKTSRYPTDNQSECIQS